VQKKRMDEVVFLEELISIPSPSGQEDAVAEYLVRQMAALGFRARRDEVGNVVGTLGDAEAERAILLLGHIDTVPGLVPVRWEGDWLYGRGSVDAKGPLAAFADVNNDGLVDVIVAGKEKFGVSMQTQGQMFRPVIRPANRVVDSPGFLFSAII